VDNLNEFSDATLTAAYLCDKLYTYLKKRKILKSKKKKIHKESLDIYLEHIQERFFNTLNCKRVNMALKSHIKDLQDYLNAVKKECGNPPKAKPYQCKALKEGAIGLKELVDETKEKIRKQCSNNK